ncbi:MAG: glycosyltransferase family 2 protein [Candidatus Berkelbacteria bacterium]|nr:glycosyltransferase family 2 protein [Candidatus Berkelbacteria bacterium]
MEPCELSIIIVDYKSFDLTANVVSDIEKFLPTVRHEILIVDNDGTTTDKFRDLYRDDKNIKIIRAEKNRGFGAGNNLGAKSAKGKYLLLLNPDTRIVDDSISKMLDFLAAHPEIGVLSPLIYQPDGKTLQRHFFADFQSFSGLIWKRRQNNARVIPNFSSVIPAHRVNSGGVHNSSDDFFLVEMTTAAALMIRRDLFEKLGGFDQKFFMYFEDEDLCRRITKLGLKNAVLKTAKIIHLEGQSSNNQQKKKFYYASQNYYWQKWYGTLPRILMQIIRFPYLLWQKISG